MTPEEYFRDCCNPGEIPGYQFCLIDEEAKVQGWTIDQVVALKNAVEARYKNNEVFVFPRKVRYV